MWDRYLWGVEFTDNDGVKFLLGNHWYRNKLTGKYSYEGEPARPLLFDSRKLARKWCSERRDAAKEAGWKFTPVKVRETVVKV